MAYPVRGKEYLEILIFKVSDKIIPINYLAVSLQHPRPIREYSIGPVPFSVQPFNQSFRHRQSVFLFLTNWRISWPFCNLPFRFAPTPLPLPLPSPPHVYVSVRDPSICVGLHFFFQSFVLKRLESDLSITVTSAFCAALSIVSLIHLLLSILISFCLSFCTQFVSLPLCSLKLPAVWLFFHLFYCQYIHLLYVPPSISLFINLSFFFVYFSIRAKE